MNLRSKDNSTGNGRAGSKETCQIIPTWVGHMCQRVYA